MQTWQVLAAIAIGAFLGTLVVCGGAAVWFGSLVQQQMATMIGGPLNINYHLVAPSEAVVNQPFTIEAHVENTAQQVQVLRSVDNYSTLTILSSQPAWANRQGDTFIFDLDLQPGQTEVIRFEVQPTVVGHETVNLDVNINNDMNFAEAYHGLDVKPAPTPAQPTP